MRELREKIKNYILNHPKLTLERKLFIIEKYIKLGLRARGISFYYNFSFNTVSETIRKYKYIRTIKMDEVICEELTALAKHRDEEHFQNWYSNGSYYPDIDTLSKWAVEASALLKHMDSYRNSENAKCKTNLLRFIIVEKEIIRLTDVILNQCF